MESTAINCLSRHAGLELLQGFLDCVVVKALVLGIVDGQLPFTALLVCHTLLPPSGYLFFSLSMESTAINCLSR